MTGTGKGGRQRKYSEEIAAEICDRLAAGEPLRKICLDSHLPNAATVHGWVIDDYEGFHKRYARAREIQAEMIAEEIESISDDESKDIFDKIDGSTPNRVAVERAKLRVDARKWLLAKLHPKKYGEAKTVTHAGEMTVNQTQLTPKQAADALLSAASEEDDGFDGESDEL